MRFAKMRFCFYPDFDLETVVRLTSLQATNAKLFFFHFQNSNLTSFWSRVMEMWTLGGKAE
jgi:hypothetical protein